MKEAIIGIGSIVFISCLLGYATYWSTLVDKKYPTANRTLVVHYIDGHMDTVTFVANKESEFYISSDRGTYHLMVERKINLGWKRLIVGHGIMEFKEIR